MGRAADGQEFSESLDDTQDNISPDGLEQSGF